MVYKDPTASIKRRTRPWKKKKRTRVKIGDAPILSVVDDVAAVDGPRIPRGRVSAMATRREMEFALGDTDQETKRNTAADEVSLASLEGRSKAIALKGIRAWCRERRR